MVPVVLLCTLVMHGDFLFSCNDIGEPRYVNVCVRESGECPLILINPKGEAWGRNIF